MRKIRLDTGLWPVTEFRSNTATLIEQVRTTKRAVVLTQHGRGAAVLLDVGEYQRMVESLEAGWESAERSSSEEAVAACAADPVDAFKDGIDRSLVRSNLSRPVGERLRRLADLGEFRESLRKAPRRAATRPPRPDGTAS